MAKRFYYGGQAVIEGVMMRGQKAMVTAVRRPSGELSMDIQPLTPIYTSRLRQTPLLRGIIVLIEAISLGIKSLLFSANVSLEEEGEKLTKQSIWLMITTALVLAVGFFFLLPLFLTRLINPYIPSALLFNLIEGLIRLVIFIAYLKIVGLMPDIKRVFTYHGAEHKTVNAFEHSVPLQIEEVKKHNTAHVRCGTSFLFAVLIIASSVCAIVCRPGLWVMIL